MNRRLLAILSLTFMLSVAAYAQGTGSSGTPRAGGPLSDERPFVVTRTVTGTVAEVKDDGKTLVVTDKKGVNHKFSADARMKIKGGERTTGSGNDKGDVIRYRFPCALRRAFHRRGQKRA